MGLIFLCSCKLKLLFLSCSKIKLTSESANFQINSRTCCYLSGPGNVIPGGPWAFFCFSAVLRMLFTVPRVYSSVLRGFLWSLSLQDFTSHLKTSWPRKLVSEGIKGWKEKDKSFVQSHLGRPVSDEWEETEHHQALFSSSLKN